MALLRALIADPERLTRHALSREFCRRVGWFKSDGGLKDMMARVTMLAMHRDGLIELPPPRWRQGRPRPIVFGPDTGPPLFPAPTTLDEVRPLDLRMVLRGTRESKLWNEFVARYHYLGHKTLVGAQMRYAVHLRAGERGRSAHLPGWRPHRRPLPSDRHPRPGVVLLRDPPRGRLSWTREGGTKRVPCWHRRSAGVRDRRWSRTSDPAGAAKSLSSRAETS